MILMHQNPQKSSSALVEKYTMHQGRNHQPDFFEKVMDQALRWPPVATRDYQRWMASSKVGEKKVWKNRWWNKHQFISVLFISQFLECLLRERHRLVLLRSILAANSHVKTAWVQMKLFFPGAKPSENWHVRKGSMYLDVYHALVDTVRNHFQRFLELTSKSVFRSHLSSWN